MIDKSAIDLLDRYISGFKKGLELRKEYNESVKKLDALEENPTIAEIRKNFSKVIDNDISAESNLIEGLELLATVLRG